ncbi:hypothetical protein LP420_10255 [Massilia sp. B-10]|nr:hypothetical protein LP420_10255 [Massilia sp. B-10]
MQLAGDPLTMNYPQLPLLISMSDTLALIENKDAYVGFAKNIYQNQATMIELVKEDLTKQWGQLSVPSIALERDRVLVLDNGLQSSGANQGLEVRLAASGSAGISIDNAIVMRHGWHKTADALEIGFPDLATRNNVSVHNNTGVFLINQVKLRQLVGSQDHGIMAVTASGFFSYTGNGGPTNEPYEETTTYTFDAWDSLPALTAQDVAGKTLA